MRALAPTDESGANPSAQDGSAWFDDLAQNTAWRGPDPAEHVAEGGSAPPQCAVRVIAFYLPQFHPIPENDAHWGEGFTEWTNVSKALPQFPGHYQPRLPGALGFYDLRLDAVQVRQAALARRYGIGGFCYHYYWFAGRRVMHGPIDRMLANPAVDIPFCINWANEPWTRAWDGHHDKVIIPWESDPASDRHFIDDVLPFLRDPRYIRIDGRPLLLVYRLSRLKDAQATLARWRERARDASLPDLFIAAVLEARTIPGEGSGVDAAVEFPPHALSPLDRSDLHVPHHAAYAGRVYDYPAVVAAECVPKQDAIPRIRGVFPGWDNEARLPGRGTSFHGGTPALYREWLSYAIRTMRDAPGPKLAFINAWNEWAEGAYLEPDRRFGCAYLEATRAAIAENADCGTAGAPPTNAAKGP